jgi:hypothetical protein
MNNRSLFRSSRAATIVLMITLIAAGSALAANGGRARGGGGRAYSGHGSYTGQGGARFGSYGGGYHGLRGGYGYYGGWGWGGLGYGLFFAGLPLYYSTLWWNGVPYFYADANYYAWNSTAGEYETVRPPPEIASQVATQDPAAADLFAYPKDSQSTDQQAQDRSACQRWAAGQTGFDPAQPSRIPTPTPTPTPTPPANATVAAATLAIPATRQDYLRAQAACLEARGYSVQ